jgi:ribosome recycling factor
MDANQAVTQAQNKFNQTGERFKDNLKTLRTGRASAGMLDGVMVEAYGQSMPLKQVATIAVPEAQLIQLTPFDPNNLNAITTAIRDNQSLGLNPIDDGRVVRLSIPPLNEERRRELAKQIGQRQEESMVSLRNIRHEAMGLIDQAKKDKSIGEDEAKRFSSQIDEAMNQVKSEIEEAARAKEHEIMTV